MKLLGIVCLFLGIFGLAYVFRHDYRSPVERFYESDGQ